MEGWWVFEWWGGGEKSQFSLGDGCIVDDFCFLWWEDFFSTLQQTKIAGWKMDPD